MKDAKGHGSDPRGGAGSVKILGVGGHTWGSPAAKSIVAAAQAAHQQGVAAATQGFTVKASAYENPVAGDQDYQERQYRFGYADRNRAINAGLKKIKAEFPNHRGHSAEIME